MLASTRDRGRKEDRSGSVQVVGGQTVLVAPKRRRRVPRFIRPMLRPHALRSLPKELRATQVGKIACALPLGVRDPGLETLLRRIDLSFFHRGNRAEVFFEGEDAFVSMLKAVDEAREEVLLEAYILKDDETGRRFAGVLGAAAKRGVKVKVLADAFGSNEARAEFWDGLRAAGIEVRLFHPLFPFLWYQPFRDHRKILVVDRRVGFTGGMNIGDEYGSSRRRATPARGWRDTHARIEGSAAWEMTIVFREGWDRAGGSPIEIPPLAVAPDLHEPTGEGDVSVLVLDSSPGRGHQETAAAISAVLAASRKTFWMTNAYFAPRPTAIRFLGEAAQRGLDVRLLLPGISDVAIVRHAGHGSFADLIEHGVRVFEYQPAVLHAKSLCADGYVSMVGSSNMDFRSFHFNAECNAVFFGEGPARALEEAFLKDLEDAEEIKEPRWGSRGFLHVLGDALARRLSPLL